MVMAFAMTALAGAATILGGLAAVHRTVRSERGLAAALGFAAGAMLLVSVVEIIPKGAHGLAAALGGNWAWLATLVLAVCGAGVTAVLQRASTSECAHAGSAPHGSSPGQQDPEELRRRLRRSGVVVAIAVSAHNLPEGLATFIATLDDPSGGAAIAIAIAIHNIPEGVAVAAPFYGAGLGSARAVGAAAVSGLAEPLGALLGYLVLIAWLPEAAYSLIFGLVAGIMVQIAISELVPMAVRLTSGRAVGTAVSAGAGTMALSLVLLQLA